MVSDMKITDYKASKITSKDWIPFNLLLLADEAEGIDKYIYKSDTYVVRYKRHVEPIAVFVLLRISDSELEIKNLAVLEMLQNRGIGSFAINEIRRIALKFKYQNIIVGTPDNSSRQIRFYEKHGFEKYDVKEEFFVENYSNPIIEDGIVLRNMVMLKLKL